MERRSVRAASKRILWVYGNMGSHMKTTVDLSDALLIAAKKRAAEDRTTLRAILERGLRRELNRPRGRVRRPAPKIHWVTVEGGLPEGADVSDRARMHDWLRGQR